MIKQARVEVRVDSKLKKQVSAILRKLDLSESQAVRMFFRQIALTKGIPFSIKVPNEETIEAFNEIKTKKLREFDNFDEYLNKLDLQ